MPLVLQKARTSPLASPELTASEKRMMGYLTRAWDQQKQHLLEQEGALIDALTHGPEPRVLALIDDMPLLRAQEQIDLELRYEAIASAERTRIPGVRLRKLKEPLVLDLTEPRRQSADWARKRAGTLITEITTDQRTAVRNIIADAEQVGISPRDTARRLRDVVGITSTQAGWVSNYRDRILTDGLARGLPAARAEQRARTMGDKYARRVHTYRAETIARTEIAFASHQGRREVWAAAFGEGYIDATWRKKWVTNEDGRECEECATLNETTVLLTEDFIEGDPPLHPNCRCDVQLLEPEPGASMTGPSGQEVADQIDVTTAATQTAPADTLPQWAKDAGLQDALDELPANFDEIGMSQRPESDLEYDRRYTEDLYRGAAMEYGLIPPDSPMSATGIELRMLDAIADYNSAQQDFDDLSVTLAGLTSSDPDYIRIQADRDAAQADMLENARWQALSEEIKARRLDGQHKNDWQQNNPKGYNFQPDIDDDGVPGPTLIRHMEAIGRVGEIIDAEARRRVHIPAGVESLAGGPRQQLLPKSAPHQLSRIAGDLPVTSALAEARLAVMAELRRGDEHVSMLQPMTPQDKKLFSNDLKPATPSVTSLRADALMMVPESWLARADAAGRTVAWGTADRGFQMSSRLDTKGRSAIAISGDNIAEQRATARHEIAHWVSELSPATQRLEYALLRRIIVPKGKTKPAKPKPGHVDTKEVHWVPVVTDVFSNWYTTRSYRSWDRMSDAVRGLTGGTSIPSEILSTGTQAAFPQDRYDLSFVPQWWRDGLEDARKRGRGAVETYIRTTSPGEHIRFTLGLLTTLGRTATP